MPGGRRRRKKRARSNATIRDDSPTKRLSPRCAMIELPEDMFLEICGFLEPLDLIHLARVNKPFRALLMNRSSRGAWKSARTNVPYLPHPFPGMSEPAWAHLAFASECTFCSNTVYVPDFVLRARICYACLNSKVVGRKELYPPLRCLLPLLPSVRTDFRGNKVMDRYCLKAEWDDINGQISTLTTDQELRTFIKDKLAWLAKLNQHAALCDKQYNQRLRRWMPKLTTVDERLEQIQAKLKELECTRGHIQTPARRQNGSAHGSRIRDDTISFAELVMETKERAAKVERERQFRSQKRRPTEIPFEEVQTSTFNAKVLGLALLATAVGVLRQVWGG
ncbi:hypothetical protein EDD85DRAFT_936875 [Armillaria nabsnona]|nr:hypothetical protein EDD85DRAFT_936875 [Armillaria nabsnona]